MVEAHCNDSNAAQKIELPHSAALIAKYRIDASFVHINIVHHYQTNVKPRAEPSRKLFIPYRVYPRYIARIARIAVMRDVLTAGTIHAKQTTTTSVKAVTGKAA